MEYKELEKYIFDPKNPKGCKVYDLLLHIVKNQKEFFTFFSIPFLLEIFEESIITKEFEDKIWDKPNNFNKLTTFEKMELYKKLVSEYELKEHIRKSFNSSSQIKEIFNQFIVISKYTQFTYLEVDKEPIKLDMLMNRLFNKINIKDLKVSVRDTPNKLLFISKDDYPIVEKLTFTTSSIAITTIENYKFIKDRFFLKKDNLKILLLQDLKDIKIVLNKLYSDIKENSSDVNIDNNKIKTNKKEQDIKYLDKVIINRYFYLRNIDNFNNLKNKKEIYIVGENGNGKTIFLQAIILALKEKQEDGIVFNFIKDEKNNIDIKAFDSENNTYQFSLDDDSQNYENIFAYGVNRNLNDSDKKDELGYLTLFNENIYLNNPIKWLQYLDYKRLNDEQNGISLEIAKKFLIEVLDKNVDIKVTPDEVSFNEKGTKVTFEQLSDGYKSIIIFVCDLIERLSRNQPTITTLRDFRGIVLVDEIDLHLHPKWKYSIVKRLRSWLPNIQFIFTTHSPIILLGASEKAVFYKIYKEDGISKISQPLKSIKNMMANTLITSPLVNLESARAENSDGDIDTSDDFLYSKIHQKIAQSIVNDSSITEDDIFAMIDKELQLFEEENEKSN